MKPSRISTLFHTLCGTFRRCASRFPMAVAFTAALTAYLLYLVATEMNNENERLLVTLGYYFSVGTVLSLSLHLWGEEMKRRTALAVHVVAQVLLAADTIFLYHSIEESSIVGIAIAHVAGVLAIGLSVFFLSFLHERDDIAVGNFAQQTVAAFVLTVAIGMVMSGGLCLLLASLQQLFGMEVSHRCYLYILVVCCVTLPLLMFLSLLPQGKQKHNCQPHPTAFARNILRYLFLPLAGLYLSVLYIYAARIIIRWELPNGWVSWLVTALMAGIIAIEAGLYSARIKYNRRSDERIARWLPLLTLPLLILMTVGIGRRFADYGLTINRLYLATLNAWFYFVCIGLIAGRARRISWIPISFSLVFLLTSSLPVNYASITRNVLRNEVKKALAQSKQAELPLPENEYEEWLKTLPRKEAKQINDKLEYLSSWYGTESTSDMIAEGTLFYSYFPAESDSVEIAEEGIFYDAGSYTLPVPNGYRYCTFLVSRGTRDSLIYRVPLENKRIAPDTLCLPLDTLRNYERGNSPTPPVLRTRQGNVFVLTSSKSTYGIKEDNDSTAGTYPYLKVEGLLYHNTEVISAKCN